MATLSRDALAENAMPDGDINSIGISWAAIFAGAAGAAALSLILVILGFGLGLSAVSPWSNSGANATTLGISSIVWLAFTQLAASAVGGYLAGRLRGRWTNVHADEVYFRDTAHGFLAWAIASLVTAIFLSTALTAAVGGALHAGAATVQGAAQMAAVSTITRNTAAGGDAVGYYVDTLFRSDKPLAAQMDPASRAEAARILVNDMRQDNLPAEDRQYVGKLIARQTGLDQASAEKRVSDTYTRVSAAINAAEAHATSAANKARKAAAYSALWMFVALLAGAFVASLSALFGGKLRDELR
ncbi:MAG: hypothetical protein JWM03_1642 [Rhodocyclales bacterium]|nr:hypothetical protein [Rhodocyclales bacterium]